MTAPIITQFREMPRFMRSTAGFVLVAFTMLILQPLAIAAQAEVPQTQAAVAIDDDQRLSSTLQQIEDKLQRIKDKIEKQQDHGNDRNDLKQLQLALHQLDIVERQNFQKVEQHLKSHNLPAAILDRHQAMMDNYQAEYATLMADLDALSAADNDGDRKFHAENILKRFKAKPNKRTAQPFDPNNLPFQVPDGKVRAPKETKEELQKLIQSQSEPVQVAALELTAGMLAQTAAQASITPQPADLAATEDVQMTDEIKALAKKLNNEPVAIYNWVRNNIEYIPTYGSIQGSQLTLDNLKGNAFDTASLLIALYRAAGIPARYAYGTVQIPIDQAMNWVGGVTHPMAALELLGQGGIPNTGIAQAGVIKSVKLEHVWVEAFVDFIPSRGAKHKSGDTWVALDASFKQYDYSKTLELEKEIPFDANAVVTEALSTAIKNPEESSITQVGKASIIAALNDYKTKVAAYLAQKPGTELKHLTWEGFIMEQKYPVLPSGLPYKLISRTNAYNVISDGMRHQITLKFYNSSIDRTLESPFLSKTLSLPKLNGSRLGITYVPATQADEALWQSYRDNWAGSLPLYLIKVKPVIKMDETTVAEGPVTTMGKDVIMDIVLKSPYKQNTLSYERVTGEEMVVGIDGGAISFAMAKKRLDKVPSDTAAENLNQLALQYWAETDLLTKVLARSHHVKAFRLPSVGLFTSTLNVKYNFGVPSKGYYISRNIDIKHSIHAVVADDVATRLRFIKHNGAMASYLEGSIFDQVFHTWQGLGVSAMQVLMDANDQGIPIYTINNINYSSILPKISASSDVLNDVSNAVSAGLEVIIPAHAPSHLAWSGTGYIIQDPATGAGSYRISGGADGGDATAPCAEPEPVPLAVAIPAIILTAFLMVALAELIAVAGPIVVAGGGKALAGLMAGFGLTFLTFEATAGDFCTPLPVPRKGGDESHNQCANTRQGNIYPGMDVCLASPTYGSKDFDAYNGSVIWEVKTYNFDNINDPAFLLGKDKPEWTKESNIARECKIPYWYTVGDPRHVAALNITQPNFVPLIADNIEVDSANCVQPKK